MINNTNQTIENIAKAKLEKAKRTDVMLIRKTFYLTYEEAEAINKIAWQKSIDKSALVRALLDAAFEEVEPGILDSNEIKSRAATERKKFIQELTKKANIKLGESEETERTKGELVKFGKWLNGSS